MPLKVLLFGSNFRLCCDETSLLKRCLAKRTSPHLTLKVIPPLLVHLFGPTSLPISVSSNVAKVQAEKNPHGSFDLFQWRNVAIRDCRGYHVRGFARLFNSAARHFIEVWRPQRISLWRCCSKHGEALKSWGHTKRVKYRMDGELELSVSPWF